MSARLGDLVDDYCTRCRRLTNNAVEALVGEAVVKVRCRTCNFSHDFKNGQLPEKAKPRKTSQKAAFDAVLASVMAGKNVGLPVAAEPAHEAEPPRKQHKPATHHGLLTLAAARRKKSS